MPRTKDQNDLIKQEREASILHSSLYLFSFKGYDGVTLDEISVASKCSHGLIYHYYPSKKDLYDALIEKVVHPIISSLVSSIDFSLKPKFLTIEIIDSFLKALKSPNDEYAFALNILLNLRLQDGFKLMPVANKTSKKIYDWMFETIEKGKAIGDFNPNRNSKEQVISIVALMKGLSYTRMRVGYRKFICPNVDIIMGMLY